MAIRPDLVKDREGRRTSLKRLAHLPSLYTAIDWYADYPDHYAGIPDQPARKREESFSKSRPNEWRSG